MGKFSQPRDPKPLEDELDDLTQLLSDIDPEESEMPVLETEVPEADMSEVPEDIQDILNTSQYAPEQSKKTSSSIRKNKKIILISLCAVAATLLIGIIASVVYLFTIDPNDGRILNNVSVAGVNIGNMSKAEARAAIRAATENTYTQQDMVIDFPDVQMRLSPADTGAKLNVNAAVNAAYEYGRTGTEEEREQALAASMNSEHPIALLPYLDLDLDYIRRQLDDYGSSFNSVYAASSVTPDREMPVLDASNEAFVEDFEAQNLIIFVGNPGRYIDMDKVYERVLDAYSFNQFQLTVEMDEEETIPEEIDLEALYHQYHTEVKDAVIDPETFEVTMEVYGYSFDLEAAQALLDASKYGDTITVPLTITKPEVVGGPYRDVYFRDVLCEYQTEHTKDERRNTNLTLACAAINGMVLAPGEEFDFNTVVGKRTADKGYRYAAAYSSGKTVMDIGGGVCQVSSTIYYCCLIADLEIINRQPHSYVSSYMPAGMDATVNWGGPDFTFKNNTNYPIRIETWVTDDYVHCRLVGTDEKDYYVEMEYEIIGYQTAQSVVEVYPPDNPEGFKDGEVIQTAYNGCTVQTYKLKYDKETKELISKEEDQLSKYKKRDKITVSIQAPTEPPVVTPEPAPETPPAA